MTYATTQTLTLDCFKAYDIRGRIPDQLNANIAYRIGRAYAVFLQPERTVVGHDIRLSSPAISAALVDGLRDGGSSVLDIGQCGTEEVYFATFHHQTSGGVMVTASHNPIDFNGMKPVREQSKPISNDTGLKDIKRLAEQGDFAPVGVRGEYTLNESKSAYIDHLLGYIDRDALQPLKIVTNGGNGSAGPVIDLLQSQLPFELIKIHNDPDGHFPNGIPNPILEQNRAATIEAVKSSGAHFGLAWDGDFDRCFFFDEHGAFIEGYYLVGLLGEALLAQHPGGRVVHDPRLTWNTIDQIRGVGGEPIQCKTGHAFIKERMRLEDAVYGGEMSAHHYFRDFSYCDSGMIPWLLVAEKLCRDGHSLSEMVAERMRLFPCSGEINFTVANPAETIERVLDAFAGQNPLLDKTDGISAEFADWRFNLRASNTEPLLRLNVESRGDAALLAQRTRDIRELIEQ